MLIFIVIWVPRKLFSDLRTINYAGEQRVMRCTGRGAIATRPKDNEVYAYILQVGHFFKWLVTQMDGLRKHLNVELK